METTHDYHQDHHHIQVSHADAMEVVEADKEEFERDLRDYFGMRTAFALSIKDLHIDYTISETNQESKVENTHFVGVGESGRFYYLIKDLDSLFHSEVGLGGAYETGETLTHIYAFTSEEAARYAMEHPATLLQHPRAL